ncbi:FAD-dependent monooxygenase [Aquicella lusitana]|uniref:2-octaprenyl-6-methoxyphenol hydroxylase /2-octaprenyl-3-methyl-6-methoxy-1,4-benzoquinol hydroxylase n=1 Tax=Aquicella lusitana TaxID=254246 RepID=A0A370GT46_9COXI|nr:FAD-dependent monooxygenase [Aquicella lusitana]RDI46500.1 2-octaprenyl-6-methoxyphenol hydroxylase /2-octaprenyl-3-methyl-6-methoxy-1,4-benzoquinol hydroxylase [Aquicella lusitana]VVC74164.1 2-octaprenyl-6-methoxyphenol hydroxylase [Aquicella lusitana]
MYYDLIIVGGGLVGAGLAAGLRHAGIKIALVDARLPSSNDPRLFALNAGSCQFLKNVGIWEELAEHAAAIHQVHVSYQGRFGAVRLNREDVHLASLGYVIPARWIESALNTLLLDDPAIDLFRPAKLIALQQQAQTATLTLDKPEGQTVLQSPLVIGADGTESTVRSLLNIEADIVDYKQSALVTRTLLKRSHQHIAYERFTPRGTIAMLPLTGDESATIWTADSKRIAELMALSDELFLYELQNAFGYRLGRLRGIRERHVFPLRMVRATKAVDQCVYLLGNSAHTLHPIAAQGFNLALYEVAVFIENIMEKISKHQPFSAVDLAETLAQTQKQQAASIAVSDRLPRLLSTDSRCLSFLLPLCMTGFDLATPIKKRFIETMMGRTGSVPRLLLSAKEL